MNSYETSGPGWLGWKPVDWRELLRGAVQPLWRTRRALQSALHNGLRQTRGRMESEVDRAAEVEERASVLDGTAQSTADDYAVVVRELHDGGRYKRAFDLFAARLEEERRQADETARQLTATVHDACSGFVARIEEVQKRSDEVQSRIAKSAAGGPAVASERQLLSSRSMRIGGDVEALRSRAAAHRKQFEAWA